MKIIRKIMVKQVLTEESKQSLYNSFQTSKLTLQKECDQFRFEMRKLEKNNKHHRHDIHAYLQKEIDVRQEKLKLLEFQTEQLNILPLGSELNESEVEAIIDVEIGDKWEQLVKTKTIIIQDGIVIDIR